MKRIISIALCIFVICSLLGCSNVSNNETTSTKDENEVLNAVLNNRKTFIDENGKAVYLADYLIDGTIPITPTQYTYVDFDGDNQEELVIDISTNLGIYLLLNYNGLDVFARPLGIRTLSSIKSDGSFISSNGAASTYYCKAKFEGNEFTPYYECVKDSMLGIFTLNGENVSIATINEFINDWNLKENVEWFFIEPTESPNENNSDNTQITPPTTDSNTQNHDNKKTIYMSNYIDVSFSGFNTEGNASVRFNREQFMLDVGNTINYNSKNFSTYKDLYNDSSKSPSFTIEKFFKPILSKKYDLSNGEIIEVKWNIEKDKIDSYYDLNCELDFSSKNITTSNLKEATTFDPFEHLTVSFSGVDPFGKIQVHYDSGYSYYGKYNISKSENLSNGDVITIFFDCFNKEDFITMYGKYPSITEKKYTVDGLKSYPKNINEFPDDVQAKMDSIASEYLNTIGNGISIKNFYNIGYAYIIPIVESGIAISDLYSIYSVDAVATYGDIAQEMKYYLIFESNTRMNMESGEFYMDVTQYNLPNHQTNPIIFTDENDEFGKSTVGFNTLDEVDEYINDFNSSKSMMLFQTYK